MGDPILKGNFKVKKPVEVEPRKSAAEDASDPKAVARERKRQMLDHLGGSMVYVDRETFTWDGDKDDGSRS